MTAQEEVLIRPTVILRLDEEEETLGTATVRKDGMEALMVFRGPEDAFAFQRQAGKHTAAEGFEVIGMGRDGVAALLGKHGLDHVIMPERWTGGADASADVFTADNFLRLLDESLED